MKKTKAFTLLELLVVVGILAVVTAIAIPFFTNTINSYRANNDVRNMEIFLQSARAMAISKNINLVVIDPNAPNNEHLSGELVAFQTNTAFDDEFTTIKPLYDACADDCIQLKKPAIHSSAQTRLYAIYSNEGAGSANKSLGIAFDKNGHLLFSLYDLAIATAYTAISSNTYRILEWRYELGSQRHAIYICPNGNITNSTTVNPLGDGGIINSGAANAAALAACAYP